MNKKTNIFIASILGLFLQSCVTYPLVQNSMNIPLADRSHELTCNASMCGDGLGLAATYTLDSNIVVMADLSRNFFNYTESPDQVTVDSIKPNNFKGELAAGYYHKIKLHGGNFLRFEALGGLGYGSILVKHTYIDNDHGGEPPVLQTFSGQNWDWFLQTDMENVTKHWDYGLGIQFKDAYFNEHNHLFQEDFPTPKGSFYDADLKGNMLLLQPALIAAFHFNRFAFKFSTGLSIALSGAEFKSYTGNDTSSLYCSFGISMKFLGKN